MKSIFTEEQNEKFLEQIYEDEDGKTGREIAIKLRFFKMSKVKYAGLFIGSDQAGGRGGTVPHGSCVITPMKISHFSHTFKAHASLAAGRPT